MPARIIPSIMLFSLLILLGCIHFEGEGRRIRENIKEEPDFYLVELDVGPNYVYLKNGSCRIYIGIDETQAISILHGIKGIRGRRPNTHDLIADIFSALNVSMSVKITKMEGGIFYAILEVNNVTIDSRPSDAIAIAVRMNAPIYVSKDLMHEHGECTITDAETL